MLDAVWSFLASAPEGLHTHGHNVMLYKDGVPNVEVGVLVNGPFEPAGDVRPSHTPGGLVARATHTGPVARLGETYEAIHAWCSRHGYRPDGPRWEIYGDPDPGTGVFAVEVLVSVVAA